MAMIRTEFVQGDYLAAVGQDESGIYVYVNVDGKEVRIRGVNSIGLNIDFDENSTIDINLTILGFTRSMGKHDAKSS